MLVLADEPGWAWERKAVNYRRCLSDQFDVTVGFQIAPPDFAHFDLVHLFEVPQTKLLARYPARAFKAVSPGMLPPMAIRKGSMSLKIDRCARTRESRGTPRR